MSSTPTSGFPQILKADLVPSLDFLSIVDASDLTASINGTNKKVTIQDLVQSVTDSIQAGLESDIASLSSSTSSSLAALDSGKLDATDFTFANISGIATDNVSLSSALAGKVPLAGGTMTGALLLPVGSAASPSLVVGTNAGLFQFTNTTLSFTSSGTEAARFVSNGLRLGIGTLQFGSNLSGNDVQALRNATGPTFEVRANGGLIVNNGPGSATAMVQASEYRSGRAGSMNQVNPQNQIIIYGGFTGYGVGFNNNGELSTVVNSVLKSTLGRNLQLSNNGAVQFNSAIDLGGSYDSQIVRNATGPTIETRSAGGLAVKNADGSGFANVNCGPTVVNGQLQITGDFALGSGVQFTWATRGTLRWPNTNIFRIADAGVTAGFSFDVTTNGTAKLRNIDNTAAGNLDCGAITASGQVSAQNLRAANGITQTRYLNNSNDTWSAFEFPASQNALTFSPGVAGLFRFEGTSNLFPALKRSGATIQARLADDSAFAAIQGKLHTESNYTVGAPTPTGYLVLYDAAGTAYKVPAVLL